MTRNRIWWGASLVALIVALAGSPASTPIRNTRTQPMHTPYHRLGALQTLPFPCLAANAASHCIDPQLIRRAYAIPAAVTGKGRTIVLVAAYQSPTLAHDVARFDQIFHLVPAHVTVIAPQGLTPFDPTNGNQIGWAAELTLDVEWAHAVAPAAYLVVDLARSDSDPDLFAATQYAITHHVGDVLSQSFGEAESCAKPTLLQAQHHLSHEATETGMTLVAASGDDGAAQPTCDGTSYQRSVSTPASDPDVLSVGGTHLLLSATGAYQQETVWNDAGGASGGGTSQIYRKPAYQEDFATGAMRRVPDVSYDADVVAGGYLIVWSSSGAGADQVYTIGGTSAAAPQWAAIIALADEQVGHDLGRVNDRLARLAQVSRDRDHDARPGALHDVTRGNANFTGVATTGTVITVTGYPATRSWDEATGWGSPNVARLLDQLGKDTIANVSVVAGEGEKGM